MMTIARPHRITLAEWDNHYDSLRRAGMREPLYGGRLSRHVDAGDFRLRKLVFDNSPAALRLWNLVLSETQRLYARHRAGDIIIGAMKDLGTVPLIAYAAPRTVAFVPDGTWWVPCVMEMSTCDLGVADRLGIDETFCPVRAMLGAFASGQHFPPPQLVTCSVGATCDDFSAIAQRLAATGQQILWWEVPPRRAADADEPVVEVAPGRTAPRRDVDFVRGELASVRDAVAHAAGVPITDAMLRESIQVANDARRMLRDIREMAFQAPVCPLPALEVLLAEMLALHFCSDRNEAVATLVELRDETVRRVAAGQGVLPEDAVRVFWVNPVADLQAMNLLEDCGGRLAGTDFMFCHAIDAVPEDDDPLRSLARMALADPMVGPTAERAQRVCDEARRLGAEAVVVSRIPGASHCGLEGVRIRERVERELGLPVVELEVPPVSDGLRMHLRTRLEALMETARGRRRC